LRKPSFKFWALTLVLPLCNISPATASGIKVLPSKPVITAISPLGSGDQIADFSVNSTLIAVVGTVEAGLANLVTSPALGGSDGFITTLDKNRKLNWNLRLGSSNDDIATAITQDAEGFFWVVGATSKPVETSTVVVDSSVVNLDSVTVDAADSPKNALTRLALWKIGVNGGLSQTFFFDANGIISPTAISLSGSNLKIIGNLTQELVTQQFSITTNLTGVFSGLKLGKVVTPKPIAIQTIKAGSNKITSFISKTTIIDIPSWRAKKPTPVIVKYTSKGKALAANSLPGKVKKVIWQSGIGTVVLVEVNSDNQIHLLSNMA
jgi:hypothetical protein